MKKIEVNGVPALIIFAVAILSPILPVGLYILNPTVGSLGLYLLDFIFYCALSGMFIYGYRCARSNSEPKYVGVFKTVMCLSIFGYFLSAIITFIKGVN